MVYETKMAVPVVHRGSSDDSSIRRNPRFETSAYPSETKIATRIRRNPRFETSGDPSETKIANRESSMLNRKPNSAANEGQGGLLTGMPNTLLYAPYMFTRGIIPKKGYNIDFSRSLSYISPEERLDSKNVLVKATYVAFSDGSYNKDEDPSGENVKPAGAAVGWAMLKKGVLVGAKAKRCDSMSAETTEAEGIRFLVRELIFEEKVFDATIVCDNACVILALQGKGTIPKGCQTIITKIRKLIKKHNCNYTFIHVPSESNELADFVADLGLRSIFPDDFVTNPPEKVLEIMEKMKLFYKFPQPEATGEEGEGGGEGEQRAVKDK